MPANASGQCQIFRPAFSKQRGCFGRNNCLANVSKSDVIIEIGPGAWGLTERLLETGCDPRLLKSTQVHVSFCDNFPDLNLVEGDALEVQWPSANKVVANIPYQISSPLVEIITRNQSITEVVMLVQEEFAERLVVEWESDRGSLGMCTMFMGLPLK